MDNPLLRQLLAGGESDQVEFVAGVGPEFHLEEAACALLNARGGIILAGVKEGGRVVGVEGAPEKVPAIQRRLRKAISPQASLAVTVGQLNGKRLIVIDVPQGLEKPYVCKGKIVVRRGGAIVSASADDISALIDQRVHGEGRWERLPALGVEEEDLDAGRIQQVVQTIQETRGATLESHPDQRKTLEKLGLIQAGQFSNAALVLFGKNPAERYPQTRVRAARLRGDEPGDFLDNRIFEGNLFALIELLANFLQAHLPVTSILAPDQFQRQDRLAYPWPAVREAIVNALVHRDYGAFDGGMSVAVYDHRMEVWNSGRLPDEMTVADLWTTHPSRPINPDIAQVCFLYGLMERWGIGTQKIITACLESGLPEPEWRVDRNGVTLTLRLEEATPGRTAPTAGSLNLRQLTIAQRLRPGDKLKLTDYLKLVSSDVKERQARIDLNHLTQAGYLQRIGAGPATVYVRTTKKVTELPSE